MLSSIEKSNAETLLLFGEGLLLFASLAVVIGIYGEIKNPQKRWFPSKHFCEWLVLIGVGGELLSDILIFVSSEKIQTIQTTELSNQQETLSDQQMKMIAQEVMLSNQKHRLLEQESDLTSAKKELADAIRKTAELGEKGKNSDLKIASLLADAKRSDVKIAEAQAQSANAILQAEELHKQNLKMEDAISPRVVNRFSGAENLKKYAGMHAKIICVDNDLEAWLLAGQIAGMLDSIDVSGAQWDVQTGMRKLPYDTGIFSFEVSVWTNVGIPPAGDKSIEAADALVAVLREYNIAANRKPAEEKLPINSVLILIGPKPQKIGDKSSFVLFK